MSEAFALRSFAPQQSPFRSVWSNDSSAFQSNGTQQPAAPEQPAASPVDEMAQAEAYLQEQLDDSYRKGFADGQAAIAQANDELMACSERLASAVEALKPRPGNALCETLVRTIRQLLDRTAGFSEPSAETLQQHCQTLATMAQKDCTNAVLHLHPLDRALLGEQDFGLTMEEDASMTRGTLSLSHSEGWIEHGTQPVLDELESMLATLDTQ